MFRFKFLIIYLIIYLMKNIKNEIFFMGIGDWGMGIRD